MAFVDRVKFDQVKDVKSISIIDEPAISDNCLTMKLGYSGCNAGHEFEMIGDGTIGKSLPIVTNFKFSDKNQQLCEAYWTDTIQFDLTELKSFFRGEDKVRINFGDQVKSVLWDVK